ncbi:ABC transporter substrate-binding protein [Actinomadura darangshiensis]|uniref:ABC transporter substrate-binding protein n=1 Tax=Actinomadura darangshiensis TaxID=705336 RepID=A0A4R5BZZ8_9ACTN|nr:ABC transporter substrate-binding protein [Actinomadura darangshiensis]TDD91809.1 ABC transporter substrate-binding protein [Actinomadura darangshiensis]
MRTPTTIAALVAVAVLAAGCGRSGSGGEQASEGGGQKPAVSAGFGDLKDVCGPGSPAKSPAQGVTKDSIGVGVFSDVGFTKNPELADAAKVFTSWCNELGGVKGRKLVPHVRDTKMMEVRQRMLESCKQDFALVAGGAALDGMGTKDRLSCLLPDFPAQVSMVQNNGSDLQFGQTGGVSYNRYQGYWEWLLKDAYPGSKGSVGIISGDSPVTHVLGAQAREALTAMGGKIAYNDLYPAQGVSDWTPYAQSIKSKGVKGLIFYGDFTSLAKLEQILTGIGYKLDWIDANNNAYLPQFIKLAGPSLKFQNNFADLSGLQPLETAASNPATKKVQDLYKRYAPDAALTSVALRAFSAWLLFAKSAATCGDDLTRKCAYEAARKETAWTAGGLQAPVDLSKQDVPLACFNVEKATPEGWKPAGFKPDKGPYRCSAPAYKYTGDYGRPLTLADVGKSMNDLK